MRDELAARDETTSLDDLISLSIRLDNRLHERRRERSAPPVTRTMNPRYRGVCARSAASVRLQQDSPADQSFPHKHGGTHAAGEDKTLTERTSSSQRAMCLLRAGRTPAGTLPVSTKKGRLINHGRSIGEPFSRRFVYSPPDP